MEAIVQQVLTTVCSIAVVIVTAIVNQRVKESDRKADERHAEMEADQQRRDAWREGVSARLGKLEERVDLSHRAQCSQIRSDVLHKAHRYLDDLGCASTEEKQSLWSEYEDYIAFCEANNVENHFIDSIVRNVMDLPNRDTTIKF